MYDGKRTLKQILNTGFKYKGSFRWDCGRLLAPPKRLLLLIFVVDINYDVTSMVVGVFYRSGNTLRFPRARDEPPHSQLYVRLPLLVTLRSVLPRRKGTNKFTQAVPSLAVGSHRLRFPGGQGKLL